MAACKNTLAVRVMVAMQILLAVFTLIMWLQRAQSLIPHKSLEGDVVIVRCRNLLPERAAAVMNGVYVPAGAVRSIPISRATLNLTIQVVVTGRPLNQAMNAVFTATVSPELVKAPRFLLAMESLKRRTTADTSCEGGCETGFVCLKSPSALLGYFGVHVCPPGVVSPGVGLHSEATLPSDMMKQGAPLRRGVEFQ